MAKRRRHVYRSDRSIIATVGEGGLLAVAGKSVLYSRMPSTYTLHELNDNGYTVAVLAVLAARIAARRKARRHKKAGR